MKRINHAHGIALVRSRELHHAKRIEYAALDSGLIERCLVDSDLADFSVSLNIEGDVDDPFRARGLAHFASFEVRSMRADGLTDDFHGVRAGCFFARGTGEEDEDEGDRKCASHRLCILTRKGVAAARAPQVLTDTIAQSNTTCCN